MFVEQKARSALFGTDLSDLITAFGNAAREAV